MNRLKQIASDWGQDFIIGIRFSAMATGLKYFFQHFIDIGWTAAATLAAVLTTHYSKKYLIPWIDKKIVSWFKKLPK